MAQRLWKDVIEIPRAVQASDFVLKLSEGVTRAERTVDTYVVTKGVAQSFDKALGLIGAALDKRSSSGTYLHGSFGSGKSHFMAVLDLLLDHEHTHLVRRLDRLANVIVKHEDWLGKKKLMMVPYHFLGAVSMEECILGGYVEFIQRTHPDAPLPVVFVSDKLIDNAENMREKLGDDQFLSLLSGDAADEGEVEGWGDVGWTIDEYKAALAAKDPMAPERQELIRHLITNVFTAAIDLAANARQGGYIGLDEGLQVISQHAAELGYDGVVLFLDELILWLSRHASDTEFIQREGQKLAKLVEAQRAERPVPIISFVARQRSLSDFVGEAYTGQEKASFDFSLDWLSGRFSEIRLEDRDLPLIVKERLLRPTGASEGEQIRQSFENFKKQVQGHHRDFMRTREVDDELFEKVYPFSPALVQALVALSTFLQRERTALRLLLALLVRHRETLQLGQVVPVGDLWDVVTEGQAPFSEALRRTYQQAVDLWNKKLRPMLVEDHNGFDPDLEEADDPRRLQAWEDDARLLKTLLVAALVPQVEALRDMTVSKLTALNYSAVIGFVPSMKDNTVATKLRKWASQVGEIRITDEHSDARVSLQLSTLDVEILLDRVRTEDSTGNRRRKVRQLLYEWMSLDPTDNQYTKLQTEWRGAKRNARVFYRNVRELGDHAMTADGSEWSILVDYPFDEEGYSPREDQLQLENYLSEHPDGTLTLAWLPMFLSQQGLKRLGRLVMVEYVLDRFKSYSEDYSAEERPALRQQLDNLRSALRTQLKAALEIAYGLRPGESDLVDKTHNLKRPLHSLLPSFNPRMPGGADFSRALREIFEAALAAQYPDSYRLPDEVFSTGKALKVLGVIEETLNAQDHRYFVEDRSLRQLVKGYAEAIGLGTMGETHFVISATWRDKIERELGSEAREKLTVGRLRDIIEPDDAERGTPRAVIDLVVCTYALMEQMALKTQVGVEQEMTPGKLDDAILLERRELPSVEVWEQALTYGAEIFGVKEEFPLLSAASVEAFCQLIEKHLHPRRALARSLPKNLDEVGAAAGLTPKEMEDSPRYKGARALERLFTAFSGNDTERVNALVLHAQDEFQRALLVSQFKHLEEHDRLLSDSLVRQSLAQAHSIESKLIPEALELLKQSREHLKDAQHVKDLARIKPLSQRLFKLLVVDPPKPTDGGTGGGNKKVEKTYTIASLDDLEARKAELEALLGQGKKLEIRVVDK